MVLSLGSEGRGCELVNDLYVAVVGEGMLASQIWVASCRGCAWRLGRPVFDHV